MTLFTKKVEVDRSNVEKKQMKFQMVLTLETDEQYSNKKVASIDVTETLVCNTHDFIKQIKNELESIISSSYEKVEAKLDSSPLLSDGYKAPTDKNGF